MSLRQMYCRLFHRSLMWPICRMVRCRVCLTEHPVRWEDKKA